MRTALACLTLLVAGCHDWAGLSRGGGGDGIAYKGRAFAPVATTTSVMLEAPSPAAGDVLWLLTVTRGGSGAPAPTVMPGSWTKVIDLINTEGPSYRTRVFTTALTSADPVGVTVTYPTDLIGAFAVLSYRDAREMPGALSTTNLKDAGGFIAPSITPLGADGAALVVFTRAEGGGTDWTVTPGTAEERIDVGGLAAFDLPIVGQAPTPPLTASNAGTIDASAFVIELVRAG
jgi:hypothetical protein